jgi:hypothetical protein
MKKSLTKTKKKYSQKKTPRKNGMMSYKNDNHPKHLRKDKNNMDCAAQVFQLLKFTDMPTSKYLRTITSNTGLGYGFMEDMLNQAYPNNGFEWILFPYNNDLNKYILPNQGTILFIDASQISPYYKITLKDTNSINSSFNHYNYETDTMYKETLQQSSSHYVALFRKNKKGPQSTNCFIRDPQERTTAYTLRQFMRYWYKYTIYILIRRTPTKALKPYGVTLDILKSYD